MCIYRTTVFPLIFKIYFGFYKIYNNECIESYNICFIKLYLFLFGVGELKMIENTMMKINATEWQESLVIILAKIISSDQDLYNICGAMFPDKLPLVLQSTLEKIISNLFILKTVLSFKEITKCCDMIAFCS